MSAARKLRRAQKGQAKVALQTAIKALPDLTNGIQGIEELREALGQLGPTLTGIRQELEIQRLTNLYMARAIMNCSDEAAQKLEAWCRQAAEQRVANGEGL
jgi:hypothetical protein